MAELTKVPDLAFYPFHHVLNSLKSNNYGQIIGLYRIIEGQKGYKVAIQALFDALGLPLLPSPSEDVLNWRM
jgi:hypothetical protein